MPSAIEQVRTRVTTESLQLRRDHRFAPPHPGALGAPHDRRSPARHDRDRFYYADAWRRLAGVAQVVSPYDNMTLVHTRLTHSLKVAQVARSLAETLLADDTKTDRIAALGGIDADVVEAAGLGHDLGHAPFGHAGEAALDYAARVILRLGEGFEANAQTLRQVLVTEQRSDIYDGMNLTPATIVALAKYPWIRAMGSDAEERPTLNVANFHQYKFSLYMSELETFGTARRFLDGTPLEGDVNSQSIEASLMDCADDITYAVHDLEDFMLAGVLNPVELVGVMRRGWQPQVRQRGSETHVTPAENNHPLLVTLAEKLRRGYPRLFCEEMFTRAIHELYDWLNVLALALEGLPHYDAPGILHSEASARITRYVEGVRLVEDSQREPGDPWVGFTPVVWHELQILKELVRYYVIQRPDIGVSQHGQREVIIGLVEMLKSWVEGERGARVLSLPGRLAREIALHEALGNPDAAGVATTRHAPRPERLRSIVDFLCTLTDGQCLRLYEELRGARSVPAGLLVVV